MNPIGPHAFTHAILDNLPYGITLCELLDAKTKEFRYLYVNQKLCELTGFDLKQFMGMTLREAFPNLYEGDAHHPYLDACLEAFESGKVVMLAEVEYGDENLAKKTYRSSFASIGNNLVLNWAEDIAELKAMQNDLAAKNKELAISKEVLVLHKALQEKSEALEKSNRELEQLTYSVSHNLQAPVRHIIGYTDWILEDEKESLSPRGSAQLGKVLTAARRLESMIRGLLRYSRTRNLSLHLAPINMDELVRDLIQDYEVENPQIQWQIEPLPMVYADEELIRQVMENLLSNAVKFSTPTSKPRIEIKGIETAESVRIEVIDNGVGFNEAYADKLFAVFQQLHARSLFGGTGLGLANCKRIITMHRGEIGASGKEGEGASFFFRLPKP